MELNQLNTPVKTALFVDFDNIYIGLSKTDPVAAERFASDPARWLSWLERGLPVVTGNSEAPRPRSILIRRCYPNPDAGFRRFRSFFTSAAFSVIDCPSLTRTGKNSSDIYMVMDILDTLEHKTHFDEFIIFSGDSDFMPVLLRLRAHDRRTTTLAVDFMPPAYKAACDLVINEETFIEDALGVSHEGGCAEATAVRARVAMPLLKEMAARVFEATCEEGEVAGASLPEILKDFREFRDSTNWLGFGTSQRLAEALVCCEPRLQVIRLNPMMYKLVSKPEGVIIRTESLPAPLPAPLPAQSMGKNGDRQPAERPSRSIVVDRPLRPEQVRLRAQVIELVREIVTKSRIPLLLARVSQDVVSKLGPQVLESQWGGAGSFKRLLQSTENLGLEITTQPEPGYIFDPNRHTPPSPKLPRGKAKAAQAADEKSAAPQMEPPGIDEQAQETGASTHLSASEMPSHPEWLEEAPEDTDSLADYDEQAEEEEETYEEALPTLDEFIHRVSRVTGAPELTPHQYALAFRGIVRELQAIALGEKIYSTYQSSKAISDWCVEQGETVSRNDVVLILKGIIFQDGVRFGKRPGSYTAQELAHIVRNNIKALCQRSRLELSDYEDHLLDEWMVGGLEEM